MPPFHQVLLTALALTAVAVAAAGPRAVLQVLVDDLGWADVGWHRGPGERETPTPRLDALRAEGVELNRFYVHAFCTPSRSALLSGRLPVHVQQVRRRDDSPQSRRAPTRRLPPHPRFHLTHPRRRWTTRRRPTRASRDA